jgi:23S rRNA pseudouridine1911/1915/1917 synthase
MKMNNTNSSFIDSKIDVLYEDNHIIAVNKSNRDLVQADQTGDVALIDKVKEYLKKKYDKPGNVFLGVIHRLDRPVSGVVLFAKTSKGLTRMNKLFKEKNINKIYWAIVKNSPKQPTGILKHYLVRNTKKNKSYSYPSPRKDAKEGELSYSLIAESNNYFLLEIKLHTGRHHQIRSQLSKIGCPIKGDLKYGFPRSNKDGGVSLHSRKISFIHPVKKVPVEITADPPSDNLWNYFLDKIKNSNNII